MGDHTFIRITNKMIYDEIVLIKAGLGKINTRVKINSAVVALIILILVAMISRIV